MGNKLHALAIAAEITGPAFGPLAFADRDTSEFNLNGGVALHGYDPVAIFPEGGGRPQQGHPTIALDYKGIVYLFVSEQNKQIFLQKPEKYEPTYGGFCAYAMAQGCKVDIDPSIFFIQGERAHYFVSNRAKRNFESDAARLEAQADLNFAKMQGLGLMLNGCLPN